MPGETVFDALRRWIDAMFYEGSERSLSSSPRRIASAADVAPRTFFSYFPSKEAVVFPRPLAC